TSVVVTGISSINRSNNISRRANRTSSGSISSFREYSNICQEKDFPDLCNEVWPSSFHSIKQHPYRPWSSVPVLFQKRSVRTEAGPSLLTIARVRRFSGSRPARTILPPADRKLQPYCRAGLALADGISLWLS